MAKTKLVKTRTFARIKKPTVSQLKKKPEFKQKHAIIGAIIIALILIGFSGWLWWTKILINPDRVLDDALAKSLQINSVSRTVTQGDANSNVNQTAYLSFFAPTITAESTSKLTQKASQRKDVSVTTQTIGTNQADYVRYASVDGAENLPGAEVFQKVVGTWAKREENSAAKDSLTFLNESLFSIVVFGNIDNDARAHLLKMMSDKKLYHYTSVSRTVDNYRPVFVYDMTIKPADLIDVLAEYAKITGAVKADQFNAADYVNAPAIPIKLTIDIASRNVLKIDYASTARTEVYSGHNLYRQINFPTDTISVDELQKRLQPDTGSGV
jgi:hypothetical protein